MKTKYAAAALLSVVALLAAATKIETRSNHLSEQSSPSVRVSEQDTDVNALQEKVKKYEEQLRAQSELVENARQDAISVGTQDGAEDYVYVSLQEQAKADLLQATLVPQIEQARAKIAILTGKDSASSLAQNRQP